MAKKLKVLFGLVTAFILTLSVGVFAACGDNDDDKGGDKTALEGIAFENDDIELEAGQSVQLTVVYTPDNATNKKVTYESDDEDVCTVDENGLVTAKSDADGATCTITATAEEGDGLITAECGITVIPFKGEAITKTAVIATTEDGDVTNTLTIYTLGRIELSGFTSSGTIVLSIGEGNVGSYKVKDNDIALTCGVKVMGFDFPVLAGVAFKNQKMQLRLYTNNGTADFEMGVYEFTKEEAAKLVGTDNTVGGFDTTKPYIVTTVASALDSIEIWSDGKAKVTVGTVTLLGATAPMTYETTWKKGTEENTLVFEDTKEEIATGTAFGSGIIKTVATTKGAGITIDILACITLNPAGQKVASVVLDRVVANEAFDFNIPYVKVSTVTWAQNTVSEGKYAMVSGTQLADLNAIATFNADATLETFQTVTSSDPTIVLVKENKTLVPLKAGKATITAKVDDKVETIEVTVTYPTDKNYEEAVKFANDTRFQYVLDLGTYGKLTYNVDFLADGHVCFAGYLGAAVLESTWGEYTLVKDGDTVTSIKVKFYNTQLGSDTFNNKVSVEEITFTITTESGKMKFTVTGTDDNGQTTSTEYVETEIPAEE